MNVCVGERVDGCVDKQVGGSYDKTNGEKPIERLPEKGAAAHEGKHSDPGGSHLLAGFSDSLFRPPH